MHDGLSELAKKYMDAQRKVGGLEKEVLVLRQIAAIVLGRSNELPHEINAALKAALDKWRTTEEW